MSCKPGMKGCRLDCLHRRLVQEYHCARQAWEEAAEAATAAYAAEMTAYAAEHPAPTFRGWIEGLARPQEDAA